MSFDQNAVAWFKAFRDAGPAGVLSMLHAEDASIMAEAQERLMAEGKGSIHNFSQSAPVVAEVVAVQRAVAIAEATGTPIYILHTSSGRALQVAEDAMRRGLPVFVETRPMYLHLTAEVYQRPDAGLYLGGPPLRDKWDQDKLWEGIAKGTVHTIGTDHSGYSKAAKLDPTQTLANKRMGLANLQEYLPMMFSEGVVKERITLEQFVAVTSTNAAKLFGLYPRKGTIQVGSDADIVIWDPTIKKAIRDEDMFSNAKYSTYAGWDSHWLAQDHDPARRGGVRQRQDSGEAGLRQVHPRRPLRAAVSSPVVRFEQLTLLQEERVAHELWGETRLSLCCPEIGLIALFVAVSVIAACTTRTEPVKIGILHSLTGTMAISETSLRDAVHDGCRRNQRQRRRARPSRSSRWLSIRRPTGTCSLRKHAS